MNFNPISASYTFAEPAQTLHQSLPGGLPRQRADMIGGMSRLVSATFVCGQAEYEYLVRFIRQNIADDCSLIQIDLLITDSELLEFNAYIVPNTFALDSIDGITFTCSMQFQVIPLDTESTSWPAEWDTDVFQLPSDKSSYTVKYGEEAISVQHSGNTSKQRRTFFNASRLVSLRWNCNKADYIKFLIYSLSSNDETIDHLETLFETGSLMDEGLFKQLHVKIDMLGRKLNNFIKAVERGHNDF